jgi:IS30 family transposase
MANALKRTVATLPAQLWRSWTWDRGKELSDHVRFTVESGVDVSSADPHSPWQRGTNENTNGLIRRLYPKIESFAAINAVDLQRIDTFLNDRPRKCLGWQTPREVMKDFLGAAAIAAA